MLRILLALPLVSGFLPVPSIKDIWQPNKVLPLWIPVKKIADVRTSVLYPITVSDEKFALYKLNNTYTCIFDTCPHQGASLSAGRISGGNVVCPYHGFEFKDGQFCKMPMSTRFKSDICVPNLPVYHDENFIYVLPHTSIYEDETMLASKLVPPPYFAPEANNKSFYKLIGHKVIQTNTELVTENVLDMLHISFVHTFGNRNLPMPFKIHHKKLNNISGITKFHYNSGAVSISRQFGKQKDIIVENEYHLPSTTVTRVIAGEYIKTIVTRALPIGDNKTILFWELYRNFWGGWIGNIVMRSLMEKTLQEDIDILRTVNPKYRVGKIKTPYDVTILKYREAKDEFWKSTNPNKF